MLTHSTITTKLKLKSFSGPYTKLNIGMTY